MNLRYCSSWWRFSLDIFWLAKLSKEKTFCWNGAILFKKKIKLSCPGIAFSITWTGTIYSICFELYTVSSASTIYGATTQTHFPTVHKMWVFLISVSVQSAHMIWLKLMSSCLRFVSFLGLFLDLWEFFLLCGFLFVWVCFLAVVVLFGWVFGGVFWAFLLFFFLSQLI